MLTQGFSRSWFLHASETVPAGYVIFLQTEEIKNLRQEMRVAHHIMYPVNKSSLNYIPVAVGV
jgi:hypothetical protein